MAGAPHAAAFNEAREGGLALTAHAGEVPGAQRVREVLDFGIRRVAHGVTAIEDDALLQLLRARDVTLDLCPTSNVQAGIVPDLASHPIAALHRAGVSVTISTDDRTVTGTSLSDEMAGTANRGRPERRRAGGHRAEWLRSSLRPAGRHGAAASGSGSGMGRVARAGRHQLRRPSSSASTAPGSAAIASGRRSPASSAASVASATPVSTRIAAQPAR